MKRIFISVLVVVFFGLPSGSARGETPLAQDMGRVSVGARGGLLWSQIYRAEGQPGVLAPKTYQRFFAGIGGRWVMAALTDTVRANIHGELLFSQKGTHLDNSGSLLGSTNLDYIDIPILLAMELRLSRTFAAYALLGPRVGLLVNADEVGKDGAVVREADDFYDTFDLGGIIGVGARYALSREISVFLEGRYDQGFTNVDDAAANPGLRNRSFFLVFGVDYEL